VEFYFFLSVYPKIIAKLPLGYSDVLAGPYGGIGLFLVPLSVAVILWVRKKVEPIISESAYRGLLKQLKIDL